MRFRIPKGSLNFEVHDILDKITEVLADKINLRFYSAKESRFTDELRTTTLINVKITFEKDKRKRIRGKDRRY